VRQPDVGRPGCRTRFGPTQFSAAQFADLRQQLPAFATVSNPLDYNLSLWGDEAGLFKCFNTALGGDCDAGLLILDYPPTDERGRADCDKSVDALLAGRPRQRQAADRLHDATGDPAGGDARASHRGRLSADPGSRRCLNGLRQGGAGRRSGGPKIRSGSVTAALVSTDAVSDNGTAADRMGHAKQGAEGPTV
jgi:hypothetical protein